MTCQLNHKPVLIACVSTDTFVRRVLLKCVHVQANLFFFNFIGKGLGVLVHVPTVAAIIAEKVRVSLGSHTGNAAIPAHFPQPHCNPLQVSIQS